MFLGIDTGFGYTKVVSDNEKLILFCYILNIT